jgi:hypothetical protein
MRLLLAVAMVATSAVLHLAPTAHARACVSGPPPAEAGTPRALAPEVPVVTQETRIHWTRVTKRLPYGESATLEGQVVTDSGAVGGAAVDLYARPAGADRWELVDSTSSDPETGVFGFGCLAPERTTVYRVVHEGTALHARSLAERRVAVSRRMPDTMRQVGATRFVLEGRVAPRYRGEVQLQRRGCDGCGWRDVARVGTRDGSAWRFLVDTASLRGELAYRATIPADRRFARSVGDHVWRITAR